MDGYGYREIETPPDFPGMARRLECYHGTLRALLADCVSARSTLVCCVLNRSYPPNPLTLDLVGLDQSFRLPVHQSRANTKPCSSAFFIVLNILPSIRASSMIEPARAG